MYRKFRGANPDKTPMLRARGLLKPEPVVEEQAEETAVEIVDKTVVPVKPVKPAKAPLKPSIKK